MLVALSTEVLGRGLFATGHVAEGTVINVSPEMMALLNHSCVANAKVVDHGVPLDCVAVFVAF